MNQTLEGMARVICLAIWDHDYTPRDPLNPDIRWLQAMKAARAGAGFLADNVSDQMVFAAIAPDEPNMAHFKQAFRGAIEGARTEISRALRAAAEGRA